MFILMSFAETKVGHPGTDIVEDRPEVDKRETKLLPQGEEKEGDVMTQHWQF